MVGPSSESSFYFSRSMKAFSVLVDYSAYSSLYLTPSLIGLVVAQLAKALTVACTLRRSFFFIFSIGFLVHAN